MTELPYSAAVYAEILTDYNRTWWPVVILAWVFLAASPWLAAKWPRLSYVGLAGLWLWVGAVHQFVTMAPLNFMAPVYALLWILQAILFAGQAWRSTTIAEPSVTPRRAIGIVALAFALIVHPFGLAATGWDIVALPLAGAAPDATVVATVGLLTWIYRPPWFLYVLPIVWAIVAAATGYFLHLTIGYATAVVILVGALAGISRDRR